MDKYRKSNLSLVDDVGVLYFSDERVLRAISINATPNANQLLQSGLIDELTDSGLFPKTAVSDIQLPGSSLVIEHEKIEPVTYPFEWSPEMLRRAALCVLAVNNLANKYGYELKDAHPYNVLFKHNRALFVDFGSFVKRQSPEGWIAYDEFIGSFYYPLRLCKKRLTKLYKHTYLIGGVGIGKAELAVVLNPFFRTLGYELTSAVFRWLNGYRRSASIQSKRIDAYFKSPILKSCAKLVVKLPWLPFREVNTRLVRKKIGTMNLHTKSLWGNYHERAGFYSDKGDISLSPRMSWITDVVARLQPQTILELAGNQGILSRALSTMSGVTRVICSDYDANSVDALLLNAKDDEKVTMACFDFMGEVMQTLSNERVDRFRSDMVIALAVTHHLILSQRYSISRILSAITSFSSKYIIVEFMPLGLWDGASSPPLPDWYNESWFIGHLRCYCEILQRRQLEPNRIAFVGKIL